MLSFAEDTEKVILYTCTCVSWQQVSCPLGPRGRNAVSAILLSGRPASRGSHVGRVPGGRGGPAGTSSAPSWPGESVCLFWGGGGEEIVEGRVRDREEMKKK